MEREQADGVPALRARVLREAGLVVVLTVSFAAASVAWDLPRLFRGWLDDVVLVLAFSHLLMMVFGKRRSDELKAEVDSRRLAQEELGYRARHDALTGLLNRSALGEEVDAALAAQSSVAVVLVDLDRFKEVNDTLGHHVGDALLAAVSARLAGELRDDALLARLGGDEFVVLLPGAGIEEAERVADRVLCSVRVPFSVVGLLLEVDASCGVAAGRGTAADLLRHADIAMYAAKADHAGVTVYRPAMDAGAPGQSALFGDLRRAIRDGDLLVHYQPKARMSDGRVVGMEALVRWEHPDRGWVPPALFVPVAEQTGLVRPLTDAVLDRALRDCAAWREQGLDLTVAVNLSVRSLLDPTLPERVSEALDTHGLPTSCLELEITESAAMQDFDRALDVLSRLSALGIHLSVDDYGTGHASLAYLTRLPVGTLKIDRSFVQTMELDPSDQVIVRSTIELGHSLGLRVVAEGVETRAAWAELARLGCDEAQGYWLARPGAADEIVVGLAELESRLATSGVRGA